MRIDALLFVCRRVRWILISTGSRQFCAAPFFERALSNCKKQHTYHRSPKIFTRQLHEPPRTLDSIAADESQNHMRISRLKEFNTSVIYSINSLSQTTYVIKTVQLINIIGCQYILYRQTDPALETMRILLYIMLLVVLVLCLSVSVISSWVKPLTAASAMTPSKCVTWVSAENGNGERRSVTSRWPAAGARRSVRYLSRHFVIPVSLFAFLYRALVSSRRPLRWIVIRHVHAGARTLYVINSTISDRLWSINCVMEHRHRSSSTLAVVLYSRTYTVQYYVS